MSKKDKLIKILSGEGDDKSKLKAVKKLFKRARKTVSKPTNYDPDADMSLALETVRHINKMSKLTKPSKKK